MFQYKEIDLSYMFIPWAKLPLGIDLKMTL